MVFDKERHYQITLIENDYLKKIKDRIREYYFTLDPQEPEVIKLKKDIDGYTMLLDVYLNAFEKADKLT